MTVSDLEGLARLGNAARLTGAHDILDRLRAVSLPTDTKEFVGVLVSYLAQRERLGILAEWAADIGIAAQLVALGSIAWADPELLRELRPIGDAHTAKRQLQGYASSHYLVAMAAARRAISPDRQSEPFVERLRLLLLIRALEAAEHGILRERSLADVCLTVRQVSDLQEHEKWPWIKRIAHPTSSFNDFVTETRFQLAKALGAATSDSTKSFYRPLQSVLDKCRRAIGDKSPTRPGPPIMVTSAQRLRLPALPARVLGTDTNSIERELHIAEGDDESASFAAVEVDPLRPAPAQRDQGAGVVLQALEDSQYLRHSWHRLSQLEEQEFLEQALQLMQDGQPAVDRLGAALTLVAMLTSWPLSGLESMAVQSALGDDWSLNLRDGSLRRRPPRFPRRWRASDEPASRWVKPLATQWRIDLSDAVRSALSVGAGKGARASTIGDLWTRVSPSEPLHLWFGRRFASTDLLERLTAPAVSPLIGQRMFEHAGDHVQARLVSSGSRSGLPSACTYGAFTAHEINGALGKAIAPEVGQLVEPCPNLEENASGSELDVDLRRMAKVIRQMTARVDETARQPKHWVEHHNHLTALCVVALLASTGARPVNSPFESLDWIDLERGFIYVEDKHSGPTRGARLCVLSDFARELLSDHYLPHLRTLAMTWEDGGPGGTATEIRKVARGDADCRLPLFFLLRAEPTLDWIEVSESQLTAVCGNPWPLPWNVFRHLHATQLRRWGLHPEIRDALLSHGDRGAESHGAFSWRVPLHDLEFARPLVNRLASELGFRLPSTQADDHAIARSQAAGLDLTVAKPFGRAARALRREASHEGARRTALSDIELLIGDRPPSSLCEQEWDDIARSMVLRPDGLPHPMASLRYESFENYHASLWHNQGVQTKLPSVRYIPLREGASIFSEDVVRAQQRLEAFRRQFDETLEAEGVRAPRRPGLAACLAAIELILHCRVGHFAVLAGVACNSAAVKVVRFKARYWLEWAYRGDWRNGRPVYRVPITERAAGWIATAQDARKRLTELPDTPQALQGLVGHRPGDFGLWLQELATWASQANHLLLPGAMAAFLNGERETAALPHHDWIRTTYLEAPQIARDDSNVQVHTPDAQDHFFRNHHRATSSVDTHALSRCRALFDAIQQILSTDKLKTSAATAEEHGEAAATPQRRAAAIARAVQSSGFGQGDAPFVMAHYAFHLLNRPKQAGSGGSLKASTALRYWEALKPGFLDFAFDVHLPELDEEQMTALYERVVNAASPAESDDTVALLPGHARRRKLKEDSDAGQRALNELVGFHEFAHELYGLEDPDWTEIAPGKAVGHGRPGIVLLEEYLAALGALVPDRRVDALQDDSLAEAFVLFACARFGLRGGEAVGLQRRDWIQIAGSVVVLVRSSHIRSLKNIRSKRQVPLIGALTELEQALVDETLRRWERREGLNRNAPLLPGVGSKGFKTQQRWISVRLLALIKSATGNPANTIHHLRHGFACRLLSMVCGGPLGAGLQCTDEDANDARRLLMSTTEAGRRSLWAVARMLGHASPATTLKAYAHVMDAWLPAPPDRPSATVFAGARQLVDLDKSARDAGYLQQLDVISLPTTSTETLWVRTLQYLRLRALGNANAAWAARLTNTEVDRIDATLEEAAKRMRVMPVKTRTAGGLLAGIRPTRWNALIALAASALDPIDGQPSNDWIGTIGANRQIVLFLPENIRWADKFMTALGLTPDDCKLVHDPRSLPHLEKDLEASGLTPYGIAKADYARSFQIDPAVVGTPERTFKHRVALVPAPSERVGDTIELVVLWLTWLSCFTVGGA